VNTFVHEFYLDEGSAHREHFAGKHAKSPFLAVFWTVLPHGEIKFNNSVHDVVNFFRDKTVHDVMNPDTYCLKLNLSLLG
jgi:hypothetical protein